MVGCLVAVDAVFVAVWQLVDPLKKEKIELKQQMGVMRPGAQQYPKLRVVNAGEDLTKQNNLYYVSVL